MRLIIATFLALAISSAWADGFGGDGFVQSGGSGSSPPPSGGCASVCLALRVI